MTREAPTSDSGIKFRIEKEVSGLVERDGGLMGGHIPSSNRRQRRPC